MMSEEREESYKDVLDEEILENAEGTVLSSTLVAQVAREKALSDEKDIENIDKANKELKDGVKFLEENEVNKEEKGPEISE